MLDRRDLYVARTVETEPSIRVLEFLGRHAGPSVVDLGCGVGGYALRLQQKGHRVTGVELHSGDVARARASGVDVIEGDVSATPFEADSFDTAMLVEVLEHLPDPQRALREALRVARRNVLITVPNLGEYQLLARHALTYWHLVVEDHVNFFTKDGLARLAAECGAEASVELAAPLEASALVPERGMWWYLLAAAERLRLLRPVAFHHLYAVVTKPPS